MSSVPADEPARMLELVAALKHDLAKAIAWRSANLSDDVWTGPVTATLVDCLRADVLRTRNEVPATRIWERLTQGWPRPWRHRELARVEAHVEALRRHEPVLRSGDFEAVGAARSEIRDAQACIRSELAALHRQLLTR